MNIKQAAEQSGVSARNIRYYEQAGLLTPARNPENEYRIYSQADVRALKLIRDAAHTGYAGRGDRHCAERAPCRWPRLPNASGQRLEAEQQKLAAAAAFCTELAAGLTERRQSWMWTAALSGWTPLPRRAAGLPAGCRTTGKWRQPSISGSLPLRRTPPLQPRRSLPPSCWPGLRAAARRLSSPTRVWRRGLCWTASSTGPCGIQVM